MIVLDSSGKRLGAWRDRIAWGVREKLNGHKPTDKAVRVEVRFCFTRPKSHLRVNGMVKPSAPVQHKIRPDVDKLERSILDALSDVVWHDDSQVVCLLGSKEYAPEAGVYLTIDEVG